MKPAGRGLSFRRPFSSAFPFLLLLLSAAALRSWGLDWGFPLQKAYLDEYVTVFYSLHLSEAGPHPHFFDYPSFFLYSFWFVTAVPRLLFPGAGFDFQSLIGGSTAPILAGRVFTVLSALGGVALAWRAARRWPNLSARRPSGLPAAGLWAALLLAVHPVHVRMSHYAMPDVFSVTLAGAAFYFWLRYLEENRPAWCFSAGFSLGLAAAAKYTPALFAPGLCAWLLLERRPRAALLMAAAAVAGFLAGFPYSLLAAGEFLPRLAHLFSSWVVGSEAAPSLGRRAAGGLWAAVQSVHPALLVLALPSFLARDRAGRSLAWAALTYFLGVAFWTIHTDRYFLPLVVPACLAAGAALDRRRGRPWVPVLGAAAALLLLWPGVRFGRYVSTPDTRSTALSEIRGLAPAGAKILRLPHTPEFTRADPYQVRVDWEGKRAGQGSDVLLAEFDYVLASYFTAAPMPEEAAWEQSARDVLTVRGPGPAFPHHPRVRLWGKREPSSPSK
jgi:4-amino-4-deoxy-L-arabinose transferase-like glycosyltransferase